MGARDRWRGLAMAIAVAVVSSGCFVEVPASQNGAGGSGGSGGDIGGCAPGFEDCDGDGSCETNLEEDDTNCGLCGRDCLGGGCFLGRCQAIQLRANQTFAHYITVDEEHVYWTTGGEELGNGTVMRTRKNGTAPRTLVQNGQKPRGIAVDDSHVYWSDGTDGSLHRVPKDGEGPDEVLVMGLSTTEAGEGFVLLHDDRVYWSHGQAGVIRSATLAGNDVTLHATIPHDVNQLAIVGDDLYATASEPALFRVPLSGGMPERLENDDESLDPVGMTFGLRVLDGGLVFRESDYGAGENGRVTLFDPADDSFAVLTASRGARDIAVDASRLYWTGEDEGSINRAGHDGSDKLLLAGDQNDPTGIAVDDEAVYWTNRAHGEPGASGVFKVAK